MGLVGGLVGDGVGNGNGKLFANPFTLFGLEGVDRGTYIA